MLFFCLGEAYNNIHFACCQRNDIPNVAFPGPCLAQIFNVSGNIFFQK